MNKCHVAVIGAGSFGRHHVRHLVSHPEVERVTIVDRDRDRAILLADMHGAEIATTVSDLAIDAAVVAVPTESHAAVAGPLLENGVHCFIEKPIAGTAHDAKALIAAAARSGAVLQVGHIERFGAVFEALAEATGPVGHIACRRHNPPRAVPPSVDVVLDLMIHDIDLVLALAESPVAGIRAHAPDGIGQECCTAEIVFEDGLVAQLSASRLSPVVERNLIVHDDKGVWYADLVEKSLSRTIGGDVHDMTVDGERDNLALEIGEFIEAAFGRRTPRVDGVAGLAALTIANDIRAAMAPLSLQLSA